MRCMVIFSFMMFIYRNIMDAISFTFLMFIEQSRVVVVTIALLVVSSLVFLSYLFHFHSLLFFKAEMLACLSFSNWSPLLGVCVC